MLCVSLDAFYYYLIIYAFTSLNIFLILEDLSIEFSASLSGLFCKNRGLALAIGLSFFSLAGIPPLAGFYAKFLVLAELINVGFYTVTFIAITTSVLSTANYLRLIKLVSFDGFLSSNGNTSINTPRIGHISFHPSTSTIISFLSTFLLFVLFK
jgi:NADH-quinone oxidoreductase subunit N